jgi:hypothetical protein
MFGVDLDVDHYSPDGEGSIARFADGKPFIAAEKLKDTLLKR